ncbi:trafficking PGA2 [Delitschia confertaspora ATCC 74209]|uniref:Trafficking PGA2 n=1 Tax=Delitschia confertaspora ATCC 74209 TaxID=1513339 RepID=A0A9P4JZ68_9PLEO|nr:trafficking PGA2 [Delitschia confertaspora ATCC 74209]
MDVELLKTWWGNFERNTHAAFTGLRMKDYIRLIVIIGGYALLRPYIMKIGSHLQAKQHERDSADTGAQIHPNDLRGKIEIPGLDEEEQDEDADEMDRPGDWGRNARLRQRKFIRQALEEHEKKLRETVDEEEDKDIAEFLVD